MTNTQALGFDLLDAIGDIEKVLRRYGVPHWKTALLVWDPANLDACVLQYPSSVEPGQVVHAVCHAVGQKSEDLNLDDLLRRLLGGT